jgi:hypothetical protein
LAIFYPAPSVEKIRTHFRENPNKELLLPPRPQGEAAEQQHTIWLHRVKQVRTYLVNNPEENPATIP